MPRILVLQTRAAPQAHASPSAVRDAGPGTGFVWRHVHGAWSDAGGFFDATLEDLAVFEAGRNAAAEGFDAVCVDALDDSGAIALRSVLDLPVFATGKTAALHALTLGGRFAFVVETQPGAVRLAAALRQWGLHDRCAAIRTVEPGMPHALRAALLESVQGAGADVVCMGSAALAECVQPFSDLLDVPVLDALGVTCHMSETFLALSLSHSRTSSPRPLVPKLAVLQAMAGAARDGLSFTSPKADHGS